MTITILTGCCLSILSSLPAQSINTCVTSPPYWGLRDYGQPGQLGSEPTLEEYVANMVAVFREVRHALRDDGTLWLNLGDSYLPGKQLGGIPWRVALALQADGWVLRSEVIWQKPNAMPESVKDRPARSHEHVFLLSKATSYYYDHAAVKEPLAPGSDVAYRAKLRQGKRYDSKAPYQSNLPSSFDTTARTRRSVWSVPTQPLEEGHIAPYPPELIEPCIKAGCPEGGMVLDPFFGAGTTGLVADRLGRHCTGIELNPEYVEIARKRLQGEAGMFADIVVAA